MNGYGKVYAFTGPVVTQNMPMEKDFSKKTMTHSIFSYALLKLFITVGCCLGLASCNFIERRIDQTAGGPNLPADTTVAMEPDVREKKAPEMPSSPARPSGPLKITTTEAVLLSLENNRSLVVEQLNPDITKTFEDTERAVFDPKAAAEISGGRTEGNARQEQGLKPRISPGMKGRASFPCHNISPRAPPSHWRGRRK